MIAIALVTEADRYGLVTRQESQSVVLQVIEEAHGTGAEQGAHRHLLVVLGDDALGLELGGLRRVLWLGRRARVEGALFAVETDGLRVVDAAHVDVLPATDEAVELLRVRAGRYEVEVQLSAVVEVLDEPCAALRFAPSIRTIH